MRLHPLFLTICAALSLGAAEVVPVRVHWSVHAGCPDVNELWHELTARSSKLRRVKPAESGHEVHVDIKRVGDASVASIVIDGGATRTLTAATCAEAVRATAIVAVIALDPEAMTAAPAAPAPTPKPTTPEVTMSGAAPAAVHASPIVDVAPASRPTAAPRLVTGLAFGVGAFGAGAGATATTAIALDLERRAERPGSSLRISLERGESPVVASVGGTGASFAWTTGRLDACFVPLSVGAVLALRGCVAVEAGALQGRPRGAENSGVRTRGWVAGYAIGRLQWSPLPAFAFELEGAVGSPYTRDAFGFDPGVVVFRPDPFVFRARIGLLVRFL